MNVMEVWRVLVSTAFRVVFALTILQYFPIRITTALRTLNYTTNKLEILENKLKAKEKETKNNNEMKEEKRK